MSFHARQLSRMPDCGPADGDGHPQAMRMRMTAISSVMAARAAFPCGLAQPPDAYRFGTDALLLASWAALRSDGAWRNVAELGCGCGATLFALLLHPSLSRQPSRLLGLDIEERLCRAGRANACRLGFEEQCTFACGDLRERSFLRACGVQSFDAVLANPPFHVTGRGRRSPRTLRDRALREDAPTPGVAAKEHGASLLSDFCRAATALLRHHGRFFCIFPATDTSRLLHALCAAGAGLRALLPVHALAGDPAMRVLIEARKGAADDCHFLPPLVLHGPCRREGPDWTEQALLFCPRLVAGRARATVV